MFDTRIEILEYPDISDGYNERSGEPVTIAICFAQKTEEGGRENLYAGRIIHENEVAYTVRYRKEIKAGQFLKESDNMSKIKSVHHEGRRKYLHIITIKNDAKG